MSGSNCGFLTCIQVSQEAGQVVWYSHLFQNFPQFIVIHTVKGFGLVNKADIDVFSGTLAFSVIQCMLAIWPLVPLSFVKPTWTSGYSQFSKTRGTRDQIASIHLITEGRGFINWEGVERHSKKEYPADNMLIRLSKAYNFKIGFFKSYSWYHISFTVSSKGSAAL